MKKYLLAAALAALAASPVLAATHHRAMRSDSANGAYAYVPQSDAVVDNGKVIGADPDPSIRLQLQREGDHTNLNGGN
jgi:opacity protein-like surface antigen